MTVNGRLTARANFVARRLSGSLAPDARKQVLGLASGVAQLEKAEAMLEHCRDAHVTLRAATKESPRKFRALVRGVAQVVALTAPDLVLPSESSFAPADTAAYAHAVIQTLKPRGGYYRMLVESLCEAIDRERQAVERLQTSLARLQVAAQEQERARQLLVAQTAEALAFLHAQAPRVSFARRHYPASRGDGRRTATKAAEPKSAPETSDGAAGPQIEACPLIASLVAEA